MAKTRLQLCNRALEKLTVVGTGQSPEAEDTAKVDGVFEAFSEYLSQSDIFSISDEADIDLAAFEWLADYLAYFVCTDFGMPIDETKRERAEYMLTRLQATSPTREPLQVDYF